MGRQAIVTGEIDNVQATGQVTVSGQEWSARSWDDKVRIPAGAVVVVVAISGVKLIVRTEQRMEAGAPVREEAPQPMAASPGEEQEAPKEEPRIPGGEPQVPEAGPEEKEPEVAKTEE